MPDDHGYKGFLTKPAVGTSYEYYVAGFSILDDDRLPSGAPSPWRGLVETYQSSDLQASCQWQRYNELASFADSHAEEVAAQELVAIGITADRHREHEVQSVLAALKLVRKTELAALMQIGEGQSKPSIDRYPKLTCWNVVNAANEMLNKPGPQALACFFNEGFERRPNSSVSALDPDHVSRALKAYERWNIERAKRRAVGFEDWLVAYSLELRVMVQRFLALQLIKRKASEHDDLKKLKGAALVTAIHAKFDLFERVTKAERILGLDPIAA